VTNVTRLLTLVLIAVAAHLSRADQPANDSDYSADLPRIPQVPPAAAVATMRVQPGFALDLAVHEPLLASPVAVSWDEDGRLFVAEMRGYSENQSEKLGRIRLLHDDDGDGRYDRATVYADGFAWPTAVVAWKGGVFVGDAPDIVRLVDTDGDGVADDRRTVFTGFGTTNVQGLFNSFSYGLDNRIHAAGSSTGGGIRRVAADGQPTGPTVSIAGRDFSFDPRTLDLRPETGGAQHGRTTDDAGNAYVCHNSDHAIRCMVDDRFLAANPFFAATAAKESIAIEGPQAAVFRVSPVEPWRILRTRLRASGIVPGVVEGGGRPAGYFTSATGITFVRGDAVGALAGMLVVGDVGSNLVHRKRLVPHGAGVRAERVDRESELVASTDIWFRPVQFANGPDGAVWIVDMQREVIEHPQSLAPPIKKHLDLTSGRDTGRLWRLTAGGNAARKPFPRLGQASTAELVALLGHTNGWHRDTAQRLLVERADPAAAPLLRAVCRTPEASTLARVHAAHAAAGLGTLDAADLLALVDAREPAVRAAAVQLADGFEPDGPLPAAVAARLVALAAAEPAIEVRFPLALAARRLPDADRVAVIRTLLERDATDPWCRYAAFTSLRGEAGGIVQAWLAAPALLDRPGPAAALPGLVGQVGRRHDAGELARLIAGIDAMASASAEGDGHAAATLLVDALSAALGDRLAAIEPVEKTRGLLRRLADWNRSIAIDPSADLDARIRGARGMALGGVAGLGELLAPDAPPRLVLAAIDAADRSRDPAAGPTLAAALARLPAEPRQAAAAALVRDPRRAIALLDAIASGAIAAGDLDRSTAAALWAFPTPAVAGRAVDVLGPPPPADREQLVAAYRASLPARGSADAGRLVFRRQCVACHRVEGEGRETGPSLAAVQARGPEAMLLAILDPNREVLPAYLAHAAVTDDGRVVTGIVAAQSEGSVTLRTAEGVDATLPRADLESFASTKRSLMPEGFEKTIDPQAMADLLAYLMSAK
jgi:putative membrane-bound dehydrogenase-like protein